MTDRYNAITVHLATDIRDDDAEAILTAIRMVKGVAKVEPLVADVSAAIGEERARRQLVDQLWEVLK